MFLIFSILFYNNDSPNWVILWDTSAFCFCEKKGKQIMTKYQRRHRLLFGPSFQRFCNFRAKSHRVNNFEVHSLIVKILKKHPRTYLKNKNKIHQKMVYWSKGQLISKQNCRAVTFPKNWTKLTQAWQFCFEIYWPLMRFEIFPQACILIY